MALSQASSGSGLLYLRLPALLLLWRKLSRSAWKAVGLLGLGRMPLLIGFSRIALSS